MEDNECVEEVTTNLGLLRTWASGPSGQPTSYVCLEIRGSKNDGSSNSNQTGSSRRLSASLAEHFAGTECSFFYFNRERRTKDPFDNIFVFNF